MPHQCLRCGQIFEEGSSQLLKGCPGCGGNRFFFTKEPLNENERNAITEKMGKDVQSKIVELLGGENKDIFDKSGNWLTIKPEEIRKAMDQHLSEKKKISPESKEDIDVITDDEYRKTVIKKIESEIDKSDVPETIDVERPGKYNIDIKGLLDEEPIIIQKDGSYTIHLPSLFKMIKKENND